MPWRRSARAVLVLVSIMCGAGACEAASVVADEPDEAPKRAAQLGKGRLWGDAWKLVAFRTRNGLTCGALVRGGTAKVCTNLPLRPDPVIVLAGFTQGGPKPTTFEVIAARKDVRRVEVRLAPRGQTVSRRVKPLEERRRRRAGLPDRGLGFALIAIPKWRGVSLTRAFGADGGLLGTSRGPGAPPPGARRS